jgi:hypothetical protein
VNRQANTEFHAYEGEVLTTLDRLAMGIKQTALLALPDERGIIFDLSHWNARVDFGEIKTRAEDAGIKIYGFLLKASDGHQMQEGGAFDWSNYEDKTFAPRLDEIKTANPNWAVGAYHYMRFDSWDQYETDRQFDIIMRALRNKAIDWWELDLEETKAPDGKTDTPVNVKDKVKSMDARVAAEWARLHGKPLPRLWYSGMWWWNTSGTELAKGLFPYPQSVGQHMAQWMQRSTDPMVQITWNQLHDFIPALTYSVKSPGNATAKMHQFRTNLMLPGFYDAKGQVDNVDINAWIGGDNSFYVDFLKWDAVPGEEEEPPLPPVEDEDDDEIPVEEISELYGMIDALEDRVEKLEAWKNAPLG